jgi:hypothetical protein
MMKKLYNKGILLSKIILFICFAIQLQGQNTSISQSSVSLAKAFLASLNAKQKTTAHLAYNDSSRIKWSNLPYESTTRKGIWLNDLTDTQKIHIHALLRLMLSTEGYQKVMFIIQYDEDIKQRLTTAKSPIAQRYGQEKYWTSIYGEPNEKGTWGWKFEGHHISLNFTYSPKGITCTPMFIGINPALTTTGPFAGRYIMQTENELGKQLFTSLSPTLKQRAILGKHPTNADPLAQTGKESFLKEKKGVAYNEMTKGQQQMIQSIIKAWVDNLNPILAAEKMAYIMKNKGNFHFAWYGSDNAEELHYYRIYSSSFIIELTNRDGGIQHLHSLWRNIDEDFMAK